MPAGTMAKSDGVASTDRTLAQPSEGRTRRRMPPFPAFEAPASYAAYAASEQDGVYSEEDAGGRADALPEAAPGGEELSLEARIDAVVTCVCSQSALREVLYKTIVHCETPRDFREVEEFVAEQDEFVHSHIIQTPFTLVQMLLRSRALEQTPLDEEGAPIDEARLDSLPDDEADDLVATYELATTEAGAKAAELLSPDRRLASQIWQKPHRAETFYAVLEFCREPRTFPEIQAYFKENAGLVLDKVQANHTLSPDFYVDRLEKAGGLVWRGSWVTTEAGARALAGRTPRPLSK